jgi:hypothetical protein
LKDNVDRLARHSGERVLQQSLCLAPVGLRGHGCSGCYVVVSVVVHGLDVCFEKSELTKKKMSDSVERDLPEKL